MRTFRLEDGTIWIAKLHDGVGEGEGATRAGWEIVEFDTNPSGTRQRIAYRPAGWLNQASIQELIAALREGDAVRASWGE